MNSAIAKIILAIASDPEDAKKALGIVCGIAVGEIALLLLPVYLLCAVFSGAEPSNPTTKNCADLAAWARRAYLEQWEYEDGAIGAMNPARGVRTVSNIGLPSGYRYYDAVTDSFDEPDHGAPYSVRGRLETMPDTAGVGVFDSGLIAVYIGNGEVIYASPDRGGVILEDITAHDWQYWVTFPGVEYPEFETEATT